MEIRITTLNENTATMGYFLAEWGLSILVETDDINILLDAGKSISVCHNADILGIDLSKVDKIILSHSHYDHTGGLRSVLRRIGRKEIDVIAHPDIWSIKYKRREDEADQFLGMPFQREELENFGAIFNLTNKAIKISDDIMTSGEIPMVSGFEEIDSGGAERVIKEGSSFRPDRILDDQALFIITEQGLVVITGCAHRGIINTLYHAQQITGVKDIHTVIGGAHLIDTSEERIWSTVAALKDLNVQNLGLCHCTGMHAITILAREFGDNFFFNNTGTIIELP